MLLMGTVFLCLFIAVGISTYFIMLQSFSQVETQLMSHNLERANAAMNAELSDLLKTVGDWAPWDETYTFLQDGNPSYIQKNLAVQTISNLDLDLILYMSSDGKIIYARQLNKAHQRLDPLSSSISSVFIHTPRLYHFASSKGQCLGLLRLPGSIMLIAAQPVLHNDWSGPIHGGLIMGRLLDTDEIQKIETLVNLPVTVYPSNTALPERLSPIFDRLRGTTRQLIQARDAQTILGFTRINDISGQPALFMQVEAPRTVLAKGKETIGLVLLFFSFSGLLCGFLILWQLDGLVLKRLTSMNHEVGRVGASNDLSTRINASPVGMAPDELDGLIKAVNNMLTALEEAHYQLIEQEALRESEERYRALVELSRSAVFLLRDSLWTYANQAGVVLLGMPSREALLGLSFLSFLPEENRERMERCLDDAQQGVLLPPIQQMLLRHDGSLVATEMIAGPFLYQGEACVQLIVQDITERMSAESAIQEYQTRLRALASTLTLVEEAERKRIAVDLHDNVGQTLVATRLMLGAIKDTISDPVVVGRIEQVRELLEQGIDWSRTLTVDLSPPILRERGFVESVHWIAQQVQQRHDLPVSVTVYGEPRALPVNTGNLLFRAVRELLFNIVKHAQASTALVEIRWVDEKLLIKVEDNGQGFTVTDEQQSVSSGFGLFNISERLQVLNGTFTIDSTPEHGTSITMTIPLATSEE